MTQLTSPAYLIGAGATWLTIVTGTLYGAHAAGASPIEAAATAGGTGVIGLGVLTVAGAVNARQKEAAQ